jgi:hypothetical protein
VPGGYNCTTLSLVLDARLTTLLCKKIIVAKSKEVKTGCNLAESSKEDCGSKRPVLPMMMVPWKYFKLTMCFGLLSKY